MTKANHEEENMAFAAHTCCYRHFYR